MATNSILWNGITVAIRYYQPRYCKLTGYWHLEVKAEGDTPLPITTTGYRSHFCDPAEIEAAGSPVDFVQAWLDEVARRPEWIEAQAARQQLNLF